MRQIAEIPPRIISAVFPALQIMFNQKPSKVCKQCSHAGKICPNSESRLYFIVIIAFRVSRERLLTLKQTGTCGSERIDINGLLTICILYTVVSTSDLLVSSLCSFILNIPKPCMYAAGHMCLKPH